MKAIYIETAEVIPFAEGNRLRVEYRTGPEGSTSPDSDTEVYHSEIILTDGSGNSMTFGVADDLSPNIDEISELLKTEVA